MQARDWTSADCVVPECVTTIYDRQPTVSVLIHGGKYVINVILKKRGTGEELKCFPNVFVAIYMMWLGLGLWLAKLFGDVDFFHLTLLNR